MGSKDQKPEAKKTGSAGVTLDGKTLLDFNVIKDGIEATIPGMQPNNSDVIRHALHIAAAQSSAVK